MIKILAAEDTPDEADVLSEFLDACGYSVINAYDGIEAVIKARVEQLVGRVQERRLDRLKRMQEPIQRIKTSERSATRRTFRKL